VRYDERTDQEGQKWYFVIEEDEDEDQMWVYRRPQGAARAEYYLADAVWDWLETQPKGSFVAWPTLCGVAFKTKPQAMLFRLTWGNAGPYKRNPFT
jgi:hypothetical protein